MVETHAIGRLTFTLGLLIDSTFGSLNSPLSFTKDLNSFPFVIKMLKKIRDGGFIYLINSFVIRGNVENL